MGAKTLVYEMNQHHGVGLKSFTAKMSQYNLITIKLEGTAFCSITYNNQTVRVIPYVLQYFVNQY